MNYAFMKSSPAIFLMYRFVPYLQIAACLFTHRCSYFKWRWHILWL